MLLDSPPEGDRGGRPADGRVIAASKANRHGARPKPGGWLVSTVFAVQSLSWIAATAFVFHLSGRIPGLAIGGLGLVCVVASSWLRRRIELIREITSQTDKIFNDPGANSEGFGSGRLALIGDSGTRTSSVVTDSDDRTPVIDTPFASSGETDLGIVQAARRSGMGLFDTPPGPSPGGDVPESAEMINRLDSKTLRWLDSSPAEQEFLGWTLDDLQKMSYLEIIDPEDRGLARTQLSAAIAKGEGHNFLYRIRTARDDVKAIELHVAVRYGRDAATGNAIPIHVRLRTSDMTKKVRADRELRRRTKELTDANQQLRRINRELESLKNRYSDLYHNAPALYFSLDASGKLIQCNDTMLQTLGRDRDRLIGRSYTSFLSEERKPSFETWFEILKKTGYVETESRWVKYDGRVIDVWLASTAVRSTDGSFRYSRSVGRDVTARRLLEAELRDKNEKLARVNDDLSRKNKELDEFARVVAHDLNEPVRTLIAFSGFLEKDCGDQISTASRDLLRQIVEASRRMRTLISDLQTLSRAGRVTGEFAPIDLTTVIDRVRADFTELLRSRGAAIEVYGDLPPVWGDKTRFSQLVSNIVGNGLKYNTDPRPLVRIEAVPNGDCGLESSTTLAFHDNGIGINPRYHTKIFELFRRLHTRDEYEGSGAGLAICQKIVEAHGGRIWLESEPGRGSTFFVNVPSVPDPHSTSRKPDPSLRS